MTRKDSEKDSDRPHYYSQFWLDIAAGRRTIGGPKPEEEGELLEDTQEPTALHRPLLRSEPEEDLDGDDGRIGRVEWSDERPVALALPVSDTPVISSDEDVEPELDEVPLGVNDVEDLGLMNDTVEDADIPDMDLAAEDEGDEDEEEEFFEDEEEEDDGWAASRGRKKVTPKRATKQPPKRAKREPRRGF